MKFKKLTPPADGEKIEVKNGRLHVPDNPIIVWIEGDGTVQTFGEQPILF